MTCAHSGYQPCQRARAGRDGAAAADAVRGKRSRYPPSGGELVLLVFEAGARPAEETVAFVRSWGLELDQAERSNVIRYAWQQYSTVLQTGNAEMILSADGSVALGARLRACVPACLLVIAAVFGPGHALVWVELAPRTGN